MNGLRTVLAITLVLVATSANASAVDELKFSDCSGELKTKLTRAFRLFKESARQDRDDLVACVDRAYLVEHDRRSPSKIVGYLTRAKVTRIRCRNLDNAAARAHRVYLKRGVMKIDRGFVRNNGARRIASVMAHETMHNNGLNHRANDAAQCRFNGVEPENCVGESIYYPNTVPVQVQACFMHGKPNLWPGPGKPRYVAKDMVGFGVDGENNWNFAFSRDGTVTAGSSTRIHNFRVPYRYHLPAGYKPRDVVGIGVDGENDWTFVWFRDGKVSAGTTEILDKHRKPYRYTLPSGYTADDIVGMGIDGENNWVFTWFRDGKVAAGTTDDLDKHRRPYTYSLPKGYSPADVVGMAIDGENNWSLAWYRDGKSSAGTTEDLDAHRGPRKVITGR